jgi:hypothetical protein
MASEWVAYQAGIDSIAQAMQNTNMKKISPQKYAAPGACQDNRGRMQGTYVYGFLFQHCRHDAAN